MTTIKGKLTSGVEKILVIGHGCVGGVEHTTIPKLAQAIAEAGLPDDSDFKIGLDTCYAACKPTIGDSVLILLRSKLIKLAPGLSFRISGSRGPTITGGVGKRLVVNPRLLSRASDAQNFYLQHHKLDAIIYTTPLGWQETIDSGTIKVLAAKAEKETADFFADMRSEIKKWDKELKQLALKSKTSVERLLLTDENRKKALKYRLCLYV